MGSDQKEQFENATFWDRRYRTNIALGSGAGSRGQHLELKQHLLQGLIERLRPASILDVGCGDIEATRTLQFDGVYTGIDVSPFIIERNRAIRPDWQFLHGDFVELASAGGLQADLVICLDVLIHQHDRETYRALTAALYQATRMALLVNSFDSLPRSGKLSPNVAFHEPITETLGDLGAAAGDITVLQPFRRTLILLVAPRNHGRDGADDDLTGIARAPGVNRDGPPPAPGGR